MQCDLGTHNYYQDLMDIFRRTFTYLSLPISSFPKVDLFLDCIFLYFYLLLPVFSLSSFLIFMHFQLGKIIFIRNNLCFHMHLPSFYYWLINWTLHTIQNFFFKTFFVIFNQSSILYAPHWNAYLSRLDFWWCAELFTHCATTINIPGC